MTQNLERLRSIKSFPSLVKYLRDELDWEFDTEDVEDLTYDYSPAEFGLDSKSAAAIRDIKQLRPLVDKQPWGIFYLDFAGQKLAVGALRGILRGLVAKKRASANQSEMRKWQVENLLFICTSDDFENFNFAYFRGSETSRALLSTFGWHHDDTHLRTLAEYNLPALRFPSDTGNSEKWLMKWRAAFDVEKVTDEFFRRYNKAFSGVEEEVKQTIKEERQARLFTQKLFNRLMFIYFIQKKGWLSFKDHPSTKYLRVLFEEAVAKKENFFSDRLYWLFFRGMGVADLNLGKTEDELRGRRGKVPPLNGGLFELEDDLDTRGTVPIPNNSFTAILDLFERYNFTIEESTPLDVQVAVDPEMLGKVFEELVTGRHQTGSYYTPRTIVSFMCREALKHYLVAVQPSKEAVAKFVDDEDASELQNPEVVLEALKCIRVCDPACGSGAYLLGMLHELMRLRAALFKSNKIDDATLYERKRWIIENNLYGVDNDDFAVQIACLRLWLSLAIDSDEPRPLPNLDYKIEIGDSLTAPAPSESEKQMTFARTTLVNDFRHAKGEYMCADDPLRKRQLRERIENLKGEIALALKHRVPRLTEGQVQKKRQEFSLLEKSIESARNPTIKTELKKQAEKLRRTLAAQEKAPAEADTGFDWAVEFAEVFTPSAREQWRMDDLHPTLNDFKRQGTLVETTGLEGAPGGFDIVVANPPYVSALEFSTKYSTEQRRHLRELYETARGAFDLYVLFYERGLQILRRNGYLVLINPNKFLSARYALSLRQFIVTNTTFLSLVDISGIKIFREAAVYPVIVMLQAAASVSYWVHLRLPKVREMEEFNLERFNSVRVENETLNLLPELIWGFLLSNRLSLLEKMIKGGQPLTELGQVNATSTAGESDDYGSHISNTKRRGSLKVLNTGTIDRYSSLWGMRELTHGGNRFLTPYLALKAAGVSERRRAMYLSPKIIFAKMARRAEAFLDDKGDYASLNTNCFHSPQPGIDIRYVTAYCNSRVFMFFYEEFFGSLRMSGGYFQFQAPQLRVIPMRQAGAAITQQLAEYVEQIESTKRDEPYSDTTRFERLIDETFYELYDLNPSEIRQIEAAQAGEDDAASDDSAVPDQRLFA
jgi:type I restriction-modification system DNA methylase subunit